jgi:putative peptidoglycan lipid II flippase
LGLAALAWPAVQLLFQHGATDRDGALQILLALLVYLPGTLFAAFDQVLIFAFYARQDTRRPQLVGVLAVVVYFLFALPLHGPLGMAGLVAANSAQFIFHTLVMIWLLRRLLATAGAPAARFEAARLARTLRVCTLVGLGMAGLAGALALALARGLPEPSAGSAHLLRELLIVALPAAVGVAAYVAGLLRFQVPEMELLRRRVLGLVGRG